jgi:catechol 2,3-dioxygenase-like lactoylglutathione lyase family enzyme
MKQTLFIRVGLLLLVLCFWVSVAFAQQTPGPGVDAVAVVGMTVADMERSIGFYSGVLSFEKVSDVEVTGSAYEHLQGVFELRMRVMRMRLGGEFIESTETLPPRDDQYRWIPAARSNDLMHWQTTLVTRQPDSVAQRILAGKFAFASPGVVTLSEGLLGFKRGSLVRDPDGHAMQLIER